MHVLSSAMFIGDNGAGNNSDDEIPESQHGDTFHKQVSVHSSDRIIVLFRRESRHAIIIIALLKFLVPYIYFVYYKPID